MDGQRYEPSDTKGMAAWGMETLASCIGRVRCGATLPQKVHHRRSIVSL